MNAAYRGTTYSANIVGRNPGALWNAEDRRREIATILECVSKYTTAGAKVLPVHKPVYRVPGSDRIPFSEGAVRSAKGTFAEARKDFLEAYAQGGANIGIATGIHAGTIAITIKYFSDGEWTRDDLEVELGQLPLTWKAVEDMNYILFFRLHQFEVMKKQRYVLGAGTELVSRNNFVVVPPATRAMGREVRWEPGLEPGGVELAYLPPAWVEYIRCRL